MDQRSERLKMDPCYEIQNQADLLSGPLSDPFVDPARQASRIVASGPSVARVYF